MATPDHNGFTNVKLPARCMVLIQENRELAENPVEGAPVSNRAVVESALEQHNSVLTGEKTLIGAERLNRYCRDTVVLEAVLKYLEGVGIRIKILKGGESFDPIIDRKRLAEAFGLYPGYPIRPTPARAHMTD